MNKAIFSKLAVLILVISTSGLVACSQGDRSMSRTASSGNQNTGSGNNGTVGGGSNTCPSTSTVGKIYGGANFEAQVKAFVSATLNPSALGTVSGDINASTGIDFTASFAFDSAGNLNVANSSVNMKIYDSYVGTVYNGQTITPYSVNFSTAAAGNLNRSTGQFQVRFSDAYGDIVFQGTKGSSLTEGTVTFQNKTAVSGYSPASGTLGSFKIYSCVLFK
ncbi:hypothetical protein [Bdellovibrio sp. HCB2-146]|uniref:hypothetical protein n=1 Tax=Bdellovibrio sp. HCB2-146 TaxID=3394362 RepID=UPI0039BC9715